MKTSLLILAALTVSLGACAPSVDDTASSEAPVLAEPTKTDAEYEAAVIRGLHDTILVDIDAMMVALRDLQSAAPVTTDRGWDRTRDADAIAQMHAAWIRAREAYERVEGVVAPIFPFIDLPLDDRYEGFLSTSGASGGDQYLFDGRGVTGMHAIERIIFLDTTPANVVRSESTLPGYKAAALPATAQEAADFRNLLCGRALQDAALLRRQWNEVVFDASLAFSGLVDLMMEQREKVNKASSNEEESRYSQRTMADLRENLFGTKRFYEVFAPWILSKGAPASGGPSGKEIDAQLRRGFVALAASYDDVQGASIPQPPDTWSSDPSPADLATPFGKLYTHVRAAVNPNTAGSIVSNMNAASELLGFPQE